MLIRGSAAGLAWLKGYVPVLSNPVSSTPAIVAMSAFLARVLTLLCHPSRLCVDHQVSGHSTD